MRTLLMITILMLNINMSNAQGSRMNTLTLDFEIKKSNKGQILFAIYDSEANHMEKAYNTKDIKVKNGRAQLTVSDLKSGYYSFSYFYDENSNGKLDTNLFGIPKESYGFSNDEKGRFGAPDFEDCKIKIDNDISLEISIK